MNTTIGPPSPASLAGSDWGNGPRATPPPKFGSPGPRGYGPGGGGGGGRANLQTPPVSGSSNGSTMNGGPAPPYGAPMGGPPPRGDSRGPMGHPSPPQSLGRLSTSSNLSMRDPEAARRRNMMMEDTLQQHYTVLRAYLQSDLMSRDIEGKSKKARDKLLRLSPIQFHELSTDIYDELRRRQNQFRAPPNAPNFLVPKENFHPKRNQARQKLSTLPETRFRDLATDVYFELERRFPRFTGRPPNGMGPPSRTGSAMGFRGHNGRQDSLASNIMSPDGYGAKSTQSNTIVPNKSYLVEDDDEGDMESLYGGGRRDTTATTRSLGGAKIVAEYQNQVEDLQGKVATLEAQIKEKDEELKQSKSDEMDAEELRKSLEDKLSSAQALNRNLQDEIDGIRLSHDRAQDQLSELRQRNSEVTSLRSQHDELLTDHSDLKDAHEDLRQQHDLLERQLKESSGGGEWRARCEDLESENQSLRSSMQEQQRTTKEVKSEAAGFLAEMRSMIEQNEQSYRQHEKMNARNSQLETEIQEWKDKYAQLRSSQVATMGLANQQPSVGQNMRSPSGLINDADVTRFQVAVDDTLKMARSGQAQDVMEKIKEVVAAVRPMVKDAAGASVPKAIKARSKVTATVNNFITAGRNFAQSGGVSPVSLLDAAASHLSQAVVELVALVKIRSGGAAGAGGVERKPVQQAPAAQPAPLTLQAQAYQQPPSQQYQNSYNIEDDEDSDDPTAGYYDDTPTSVTPVNGGHGEAPGELLPSTTYQLPSTTYQPQAVSARKPVGGASPQPQANGHASELDVKELKHFLDDQTSVLFASIQSLVTSIRGAAAADEIRSRLSSIISTSGAILQRSSDTVASSNSQELQSRASAIVSKLEQSFSKLQAWESEGQDVKEGTKAWKDWCKGAPPIAFQIANSVRDLGVEVRAVFGEGDDDFS